MTNEMKGFIKALAVALLTLVFDVAFGFLIYHVIIGSFTVPDATTRVFTYLIVAGIGVMLFMWNYYVVKACRQEWEKYKEYKETK